jgi:hypothetical protein
MLKGARDRSSPTYDGRVEGDPQTDVADQINAGCRPWFSESDTSR